VYKRQPFLRLISARILSLRIAFAACAQTSDNAFLANYTDSAGQLLKSGVLSDPPVGI